MLVAGPFLQTSVAQSLYDFYHWKAVTEPWRESGPTDFVVMSKIASKHSHVYSDTMVEVRNIYVLQATLKKAEYT
jgi:hypothetical protein